MGASTMDKYNLRRLERELTAEEKKSAVLAKALADSQLQTAHMQRHFDAVYAELRQTRKHLRALGLES